MGRLFKYIYSRNIKSYKYFFAKKEGVNLSKTSKEALNIAKIRKNADIDKNSV